MPLLLFWLAPVCWLEAADKTPTLSQRTYQELQSIEGLLDAGKSSQALRRLEKLLDKTAKRPYEQAVTLQSLAHAYIDQGNYQKAIPNLERSLQLKALPDDVQQRSRYNLAQLYLATERFSKAIELLKLWFQDNAAPSPEAYLMLGSAYLQLKQYANAVTPLQKAIRLSQQPKEGWYQSLLGAHYELKDYQQCVNLLHRMLKIFPDNPAYWRQLSGMEMLRKNNRQALAVMELAYLRGHLTQERDLLNLAQLYSLLDTPYKAARLLEKEIERGRLKAKAKTWEQAANAWYQAKELDASIAAYEKAVSKGAGSEVSLRLAQLYLESQRWADAREQLQKIVKAQDTQAKDRSWLLLGIACYEDKAEDQARTAFQQAMKFQKTRNEAEQWLAFLDKQV
ncbi:MAG: tetratricopeptide repeat protein [Gammaproteobacteria bacterium]|nr:tetratricopeptide repeat protein [Gammaproteobacteria bacterium]